MVYAAQIFILLFYFNILWNSSEPLSMAGTLRGHNGYDFVPGSPDFGVVLEREGLVAPRKGQPHWPLSGRLRTSATLATLATVATVEWRFKYGARPNDKRRARAGSDRANSGVGHCGRSPRSSTTRPPCLGSGQYLCTDAGSARARPLGVSEVESGVEATVGPSHGINLSVHKHFTLAATRAAESCVSGVWEAVGCSLE